MSTSVKLSYADYTAIPADRNRHEIMEGEHFVNPAPNLYHQTISRRIQFQLYTQSELPGHGQVFNAPVDLQLSDHDVVQPDLVAVVPGEQEPAVFVNRCRQRLYRN